MSWSEGLAVSSRRDNAACVGIGLEPIGGKMKHYSRSVTCRRKIGSLPKLVDRSKAFALVEMLVSIVVLTILLTAIMDSLSLCKRSTTAVQNQIIAANIAQELMDLIRNQSWATITANTGSVTLSGNAINRTSGALTQLTYMPRPLVQDQSLNTYTEASRNNLFRGSVTQTISAATGNAPNRTCTVSITVTWPSEHGGGVKTLTQSTLISELGIHN